jgi:hypothetical protein
MIDLVIAVFGEDVLIGGFGKLSGKEKAFAQYRTHLKREKHYEVPRKTTLIRDLNSSIASGESISMFPQRRIDGRIPSRDLC